MKNYLLTTAFLVCFTSASLLHAQSSTCTEKVAVHVNTDFLITGETLYYSIHCIDGEENKYSTLSKLAYVELIGENEKPFLQGKIPLVEGHGAGDFFLPSTLPSGNYTLIAYTKWMRNFPLENFFQRQITIMNPYRAPVTLETSDQSAKTGFSTRPANLKISKVTTLINLTPQKKQYARRQKVAVTIRNNDPTHACRISLNVHLRDKIETAENYDFLNETNVTSASQSITILPDLRGETIGGVVKQNDSQQPVTQTDVYLSASGIFQISKTDSVGRFYFSTKNIQTQNGIQFQVDQPLVGITLDDEFVNDYKKFKPLPLSPDTTYRRRVEQRNVYSQVENAYFLTKRDSVINSTQEPFFGKPDKVYKLDDFTRFPTMEDIFREFMYEVAVSKRAGKFTVRLINSRNGAWFLNTPLILVDGIRILDTEVLMNYNPLLIEKISLVTRKYVYAGVLYDGILSIKTYTGNAKELPVSTIQKRYTSWQPAKKYYSPVYDVNNKLNRIPDFRVQLFWNPDITIEPGHEYTAEFYTSDVDGTFLLEARGFSNGYVVNIRDTIEVGK